MWTSHNGALASPQTYANWHAFDRMVLTNSGNLGIGTTNPLAKLEINGNLRFTADGSVQTTAWTGTLCGGDYAESVDVTATAPSTNLAMCW